MKAVRAVVSGRVQGVGYRQTCRQTARQLDLVGWVRNNVDGTVEILAQGGDAEVDDLIGWARVGPRGALVTGVETESAVVDPNLTDFFIQPNPARRAD